MCARALSRAGGFHLDACVRWTRNQAPASTRENAMDLSRGQTIALSGLGFGACLHDGPAARGVVAGEVELGEARGIVLDVGHEDAARVVEADAHHCAEDARSRVDDGLHVSDVTMINGQSYGSFRETQPAACKSTGFQLSGVGENRLGRPPRLNPPGSGKGEGQTCSVSRKVIGVASGRPSAVSQWRRSGLRA